MHMGKNPACGQANLKAIKINMWGGSTSSSNEKTSEIAAQQSEATVNGPSSDSEVSISQTEGNMGNCLDDSLLNYSEDGSKTIQTLTTNEVALAHGM